MSNVTSEITITAGALTVGAETVVIAGPAAAYLYPELAIAGSEILKGATSTLPPVTPGGFSAFSVSRFTTTGEIENDMDKILLFLAGFMAMLVGIRIIVTGRTYDSVFGWYYDFTGFNIPFGAVLVICGALMIWVAVTPKSKKDNKHGDDRQK